MWLLSKDQPGKADLHFARPEVHAMQSIRERVEQVRFRQQRQWMWQCLSWGLVAGGTAGSMCAALRFVSDGLLPWPSIAVAVFAGPALGLLFSILRPCAQCAAAVSIDQRYRLKDRTATALGFLADGAECSPIRKLQIADAQSHMLRIDPAQVAPIRAPKSWLWGVTLTVAAVSLAILSSPQTEVVAAPVTNDVVVAQAARVVDGLEELEEFNELQADPEIEKLLKELAAKIDELNQPGLDPKEALAKLSEMEAVLQEQQRQLADSSTEAALEQVGEALSLAEPFQTAGQALTQGKMDQAAEELANLQFPDLDRKTERAMTEKLDQAAQNTGEGSSRKLREAIGQVSQGLTQGDRSRFKDGMQGLAGECKKQGRRKKLSDLLRKQCQCLSECKSECEGACKSDAESNRKGGKNWGLARSGNQPGDKTPQLKSGAQMHITGQESNEGDVDVETLASTEEQQQAVRQYREHVDKYEQLSESVLDSEPIPLGHRQTIRRYFELIRPQNAETGAVR
jgi:hypothetical protein